MISTHTYLRPGSASAPVVLPCPVMIRERFAEVSGLRESQIRGQIERGNIPAFHIGRLSLVNVALLAWKGIEVSVHPIKTKEAFAVASGLRVAQVESQLGQGNLPSVRIGRLRLVDVATLTRQCLTDATPFERKTPS